MLKRWILALTLVVGMWPTTSQAAPIFFEDFDGENSGVGQLNYEGFVKFWIFDGFVDLIGNSFFDFAPGNGLYVDLDGSWNNPGTFYTPRMNIGPGVYELSFDIAGSQRSESPVDNVKVELWGNLNPDYFTSVITKSELDPFTPMLFQFTVLGPDSIAFAFTNDGEDNRGALLDNVSINKVADISSVPEPGSLLLVGTGMALIGRRLRQMKKRSAQTSA